MRRRISKAPPAQFQHRINENSGVEVRGTLKRLPLRAVVSEDDNSDFFALDDVEESYGAGAELVLIVVCWPGFAVRSEPGLHHDRVDGQQHRAGLRQIDQDGLVAGCVARRIQQAESGEELGVAVDKIPAGAP